MKQPPHHTLTDTKTPSVSIVIAVHQAGDDLDKALDSIRRSRWQPEAVILIDNGSTDGAINAALGEYPGLIVIRNSSNLGFGAACNQGLDLARQQAYDFTLLLNQDAQLATDTLGSMVELANRQQQAAVFGCLTLSSDRSHGSDELDSTVLYNGSWRSWLPTWQRLPEIGARGRTAIREPRQVDYVWGHCMMLRLDALGDASFDPGFFMYYEDMDLCWRLQEAGWEIWCDSRVIVWHDQMDPSRAGRSRYVRWRMKAFSSRYFYRKRYGRLAADGQWMLYQLRESASLLRKGYWSAVFHIWLATLQEWLRLDRYPTAASAPQSPPGFHRPASKDHGT
jgi:N-acetylglucosaminyl-diphospho-decaprenol L-rhamnosyltransferase